jgi:hypothetical protein
VLPNRLSTNSQTRAPPSEGVPAHIIAIVSVWRSSNLHLYLGTKLCAVLKTSIELNQKGRKATKLMVRLMIAGRARPHQTAMNWRDPTRQPVVIGSVPATMDATGGGVDELPRSLAMESVQSTTISDQKRHPGRNGAPGTQ